MRESGFASGSTSVSESVSEMEEPESEFSSAVLSDFDASEALAFDAGSLDAMDSGAWEEGSDEGVLDLAQETVSMTEASITAASAIERMRLDNLNSSFDRGCCSKQKRSQLVATNSTTKIIASYCRIVNEECMGGFYKVSSQRRELV